MSDPAAVAPAQAPVEQAAPEPSAQDPEKKEKKKKHKEHKEGKCARLAPASRACSLTDP